MQSLVAERNVGWWGEEMEHVPLRIGMRGLFLAPPYFCNRIREIGLLWTMGNGILQRINLLVGKVNIKRIRILITFVWYVIPGACIAILENCFFSSEGSYQISLIQILKVINFISIRLQSSKDEKSEKIKFKVNKCRGLEVALKLHASFISCIIASLQHQVVLAVPGTKLMFSSAEGEESRVCTLLKPDLRFY